MKNDFIDKEYEKYKKNSDIQALKSYLDRAMRLYSHIMGWTRAG